MLSKWSASLFGRFSPTKWWRKALPSYSKLSIDDVGNLVNHSLAAPLRVVGKKWHSISSRGCWRPRVVLKGDPMDPSICQMARARVDRTSRVSGTPGPLGWRVSPSFWSFYPNFCLFSPWYRFSAHPSPFSFFWEDLSLPLLECWDTSYGCLHHHPSWSPNDYLLVIAAASSLGSTY